MPPPLWEAGYSFPLPQSPTWPDADLFCLDMKVSGHWGGVQTLALGLYMGSGVPGSLPPHHGRGHDTPCPLRLTSPLTASLPGPGRPPPQGTVPPSPQVHGVRGRGGEAMSERTVDEGGAGRASSSTPQACSSGALSPRAGPEARYATVFPRSQRPEAVGAWEGFGPQHGPTHPGRIGQ